MNAINALIDRGIVVLRSAVTYITIAIAALTVIIESTDIPAVTDHGATVVGWLIGLVAIIRRVTPAEDKGLLA